MANIPHHLTISPEPIRCAVEAPMPWRSLLLIALLALTACSDSGGGGGGTPGEPSGPRAFNVGAEFPLDPEAVLAESQGDQTAPQVVGSSVGFVTVFADQNSSARRVAAVDLAPDGSTSSVAGRSLNDGVGVPAAATGANEILVAFEAGGSIYTRRTDFRGAPIDPSPVLLGPSSTGAIPAVAFTQGVYLVVWSRGAGTVAAARISPSDGLSIDGEGFTVVTLTTVASGLRAAGAGGNFLIAWTGRSATCPGCRLARISASSGIPLDGFGTSLPIPGGDPVAVASNGTDQFQIVWRSGSELRAVSMTSTGVYTSAGFSLGASTPSTEGGLTFAGDRYLLAFLDQGRRLAGVPLSTQGSPLAAPRILAPSSSCIRFPTIAVSGGVALATWRDAPETSPGTCTSPLTVPPEGAILGLRMNLSLAPIDGRLLILSVSAGAQSGVDAAMVTSQGLAAWAAGRADGNTDLKAVHLDGNGRPTGMVRRLTTSGSVGSPAVLAQQSTYVVAWTDSGGEALRSARVPVGSGSDTLDPGGLLLTTGTGLAAVSASGRGSSGLITYARGNNVESFRTGAGGVADPAPVVHGRTSSPPATTSTAASPSGTLTLTSSPPSFLGRSRRAADGTLIDSALRSHSSGTRATAVGRESGWLTSFVKLDGGLRALPTGPDGNTGIPSDIPGPAANATRLSMASAGDDFVLVWDGPANGGQTLFAAPLGFEGAPGAGAGDALFTDTVERRRPVAVSLGNRRVLVLYERASADLGAVRIYGVTLELVN